MTRMLLSFTILVGFSLLGFTATGCSSNKGQVEAPKITVSHPPTAKDDGKTGKAD